MNISTIVTETVNVTIYISVDSYNNYSDSPGLKPSSSDEVSQNRKQPRKYILN